MNDHALVEFFRQVLPNLIVLYRFGSRAKGDIRQDSDVDLAVLTGDPLPAWRRFELAQKLAVRLHCDVDLVDLRTASAVMRMQIISTGECLDSPNGAARREFEMYVYSHYARLNEERQEILNRVRASGVIYG
jgi:uncharacterized protein